MAVIGSKPNRPRRSRLTKTKKNTVLRTTDVVDRYSLRRIWEDLAMPDLVLSIKLAVGPTKILLAFLGVLIVCTLGYLMDIATKSVVVGNSQAKDRVYRVTELDVYIDDPAKTGEFIEAYRDQAPGRGVFNVLWSFTSDRFHQSTLQLLDLGTANIFANVRFAMRNLWLCFKAVGWAFVYHPVYSVIFFGSAFVVFVFVGGAICRCAALEFARNEKPGLFEALHFASDNFRAFLCAPLVPLGLAAFFMFILLAAGLLAAVPWVGELVIGLLFGLILLLGLLIAVMIIGAAAGGLLLFPSVAFERTSGLDAVGRAFCYILNKPLWMAYYVFISAILGTFFYLVFRWIVFLILNITYAMLGLGMAFAGHPDKLQRIWVKPEFFGFVQRASETVAWTETAASVMVFLFLMLIISLLISYVISFLFSTAVVVYALMRKKVDKVEMDRIFVHLDHVTSRT